MYKETDNCFRNIHLVLHPARGYSADLTRPQTESKRPSPKALNGGLPMVSGSERNVLHESHFRVDFD